MRQHLLPSSMAVLACLYATMGQAHEGSFHCEAVTASVADAGFDDVVTVTCNYNQALIAGDTYPDHEMMTGIIGTNEQVPVPASDYASPITLAPAMGSEPHTRDAALGVAVNGVPIYDYTAGGEMSQDDLANYQAKLDTVTTGQLDACGGHAGRGDDYHYHAAPTCMIDQMKNKGPDAIIGWAFDGFPIYADTNPNGTVIADGVLDVCNGQSDDVFGYRYHTSEGAPYIIQCLMGEVPDIDALPRVRPLSPAGGGRGAEAGRPPQGGVEDLVFVQGDDGERTMTYSYEGADYYIKYAPSGTENCYNFETRTVTNGGELFEQELCRE
ncbi:YHYH protein [Oceaniovalibus sp. ACAM 378]|uniref:YHYH protein n=1 Tax=Oceaniovalibus sp. ACAM 378 TaxID=2599923 RepID=UPI0011D4085D|nr:YHYH protein [Oceaniovalibus sp. ACAM 378]TYB84008.1 YHYH protein [Oceaniovalibus sp. ACAM 378]